MEYQELVIKFAERTKYMGDPDALSFLACCFLRFLYLTYIRGKVSDHEINFIFDDE